MRPKSAWTVSSKFYRSHSATRPLSGKPESDTMTRTMSSTTFTSMAIQGKQIRPLSALSTTFRLKDFGFSFYKWPQSGSQPYTHSKYSIPKWKSK